MHTRVTRLTPLYLFAFGVEPHIHLGDDAISPAGDVVFPDEHHSSAPHSVSFGGGTHDSSRTYYYYYEDNNRSALFIATVCEHTMTIL